MKIQLLDAMEKVVHEQEVILTARSPELIRWKGKIYAHHFTHCPHQISKYKLAPIFSLPAPLPPGMVRRDDETA